MKTILIIIALAGSTEGGLSIHSVQFASMDSCRAAAEALLKGTDSAYAYSYRKIPLRISAVCVKE